MDQLVTAGLILIGDLPMADPEDVGLTASRRFYARVAEPRPGDLTPSDLAESERESDEVDVRTERRYATLGSGRDR